MLKATGILTFCRITWQQYAQSPFIRHLFHVPLVFDFRFRHCSIIGDNGNYWPPSCGVMWLIAPIMTSSSPAYWKTQVSSSLEHLFRHPSLRKFLGQNKFFCHWPNADVSQTRTTIIPVPSPGEQVRAQALENSPISLLVGQVTAKMIPMTPFI